MEVEQLLKEPPKNIMALAASQLQKSSKISDDVPSTFCPTICHGRVPELEFESMVPPQWWKSVFADSLYLKTDGDVIEDPLITEEEIRMLEANQKVYELFQRSKTFSDTSNAPKVLDLCCGQGRHSLYLAEKYPSLQIFGHDQSSFLISVARERSMALQTSESKRKLPQFSIGDCRSIPHNNNDFDMVMIMGNSFGYFSASDVQKQDAAEFELDGDRQVLQEINRVLKQGGRMVLDLADGDYLRENFSPRSWEWIDDQTFVCRERALSSDMKRLHSREVVVVTNRGVVRDQFYSERLYGKEELVDMLHEAGFEVESDEAVNEEGLNTVTAAKDLSQRGQDLGMMEQRLLIFSKKVRLHPRLVKLDQLKEETHPYLNAQNALAVREWLERLSPDMFTRNALSVSVPPMTSENVEQLKAYILKLKETMLQTKKLSLEDTAGAIACLNPSVYHLLPPPPFPKDKVAVVLGDTSIPCRDKLYGQWNKEDFDTRKKLMDALTSAGFIPQQLTLLESHKDLVQLVASKPSIFALNFCDEGYINDALKELHVPALFETCDIPYSGAGPVSLAICYDKGLVNATASKLGVPVPKEANIIIPVSTDLKEITFSFLERSILEKEECSDIIYPAFVKPMKGDNSLGITSQSIAQNRTQLVNCILNVVQEYSIKEYVIQEYLGGTEYSVGMIGNPETGFHFFPILQVDYSKILEEGLEPILGWDSKWNPDSPYWKDVNYVAAKIVPNFPSPKNCEATLFKGSLTEEEESCLKAWCVSLFERFGCRDYARFDWRADKELPLTVETKEVTAIKNNISNTTRAPVTALKNLMAIEREDDKVDIVSQDDRLSSQSEVSAFTVPTNANSGTTDSARGSNDSNDRERHINSARTIKLLEVNPNPGWCWDGKMAKMAMFEGKSYEDLIKSIAWASWERLYGKSVSNS